ncbi:glycosyl hydrolase family 28 protein [Niabella aurantiaca]|uniref:glycosyl hydrolase family 28 protein n=1 Tax=Niabella aurantiaca TaxID=379900 RepID=UPI0003652EF0|nr:glycosyl hydrolase family 28 protein [Niabella aurantiaca]
MTTVLKSFFIFLLQLPFLLCAQARAQTKALHILTLGDSNGSFPYSWPQQLKQALPGTAVVNISRSGRTIGFVNNGDSTLNALGMLEKMLTQAVASANGRAFDFIVLELGTNDAKSVFANRQQEVPRNLEQLIRKIKSSRYPAISKAAIIIIAPPPYGTKAEATEKYRGGNLRVEKMSRSFKEVALRNGCFFVNGYKTPGLHINTMTTDGLHLDAAGSAALIAPVAALIRRRMPAVTDRPSAVVLKSIPVKAPFKMPALKVPDFSRCPRIRITDLGAVTGDREKTSLAIRKAIDQANKNGGGVVVIPEGEWLTKKIHLKSNVNLHLEKGAVLLFSGDPADYLPAVYTSWEGMECYNYSPLIYAWQCKNIAITGEGTLKATMDTWKQWFARPRAHMESLKRLYNLAWERRPVEERQMVNDTAHLRPQFIQFNRSEHILLEGVHIVNSPFWTIHPYLCNNVVIRNIHVYAHGHNNDGVDPEMSQNVLIEHCVFDQGDDAIAIKSGRNPEGWRLKTPSKNIVIRNCTVKNGHQLVALGSELSGGIENIFVNNCTVLDGAKLNHLLFIKTNERMGGYVRNIYASGIKAGRVDEGILGIETDVLYQWRSLVPTYEKRLTPISNVFLNNVTATSAKFISRILAQKALPVTNVSLTNVTAGSVTEQQNIHEHVNGFQVR